MLCSCTKSEFVRYRPKADSGEVACERLFAPQSRPLEDGSLPLPLGEGWGEGINENTLILAFSQREKGLKARVVFINSNVYLVLLAAFDTTH